MFKVSEILAATQGKLLSGSGKSEVGGISIDSRTIKNDHAFIAIKGNNFNGHNFINEAIAKGAKAILTESPDLRFRAGAPSHRSPDKVSFIAVKDTVKALGDIAGFNRRKYDIPVIAVTGSAGKTTLKEMISRILSLEFNVLKNEGTKNNHIGLPLALLKADSSHDIIVLEAGTSHPGEIAYLAGICQPNIGVITNIGPSHLEYFGGLSGVFKEKYALINMLKNPYIAVLNADDRLLRKKTLKGSRKPVIFGFSVKHKSDFSASGIKYGSHRLEFYLNRKYKFILNTFGINNIYNALAAIAVARIFGMRYNDMSLRLSGFVFPQGRLNLMVLNKVRFLDDTYNSNPLSLKYALKALDNLGVSGRKIFIMGDMLELGESKESFHARAGQEAAKTCDTFITVGKLSKLAAETARTYGLASRNIFSCKSARQARDILFNKIAPKENDIVLVKGSRAMKMEGIFK